MNNSVIGKIRHPRVVVVGGGATGAGIAADAALRGFEVILIERGDLGNGTSGRFHGMLHSGVRYVVNDPLVATECFSENQILRRIAPSAVSGTGGLFVAFNHAEEEHADTILQACRQAGIPCEELSVRQALAAEPGLNRSLRRAFKVPDGSIDGLEILRLNRQVASGVEIPARFMTNHDVVRLHRNDTSVSAVEIRDATTGEIEIIECDYVINAAGVWAGNITRLASIELPMVFDKGTMIIFQDQFSTAVLNRCRPEDDGDLLVPHDGRSVMGTTARVIDDPDNCLPTQEEVDLLLLQGAEMVPGMKGAAVERFYAGVRPLLKQLSDHDGNTSRSISRSFKIIDHSEDGVDNFITVVGGKVTLYRRMAEEAVDVLCEKSGVQQGCETAQITMTG